MTINSGYEFLKVLKKPYKDRNKLVSDLKKALIKDRKNRRKEIAELNNFVSNFK